MKEKISTNKIIEICNGKALTGAQNNVTNFTIDSRNIEKDGGFIAIKGENLNGNNFVEKAIENGASICIVDEEIDNDLLKKYESVSIIKVDDGLKALQEIAKYKRSLYNIPVVAVTGSVGKTSTKDIIASVLGKKYKVLKTEGNFNNHIGLPLTLLKLKDHTAVVVEMGMNHFGEIRKLTNIAKPTIAVITNIGTSHIGNLGSRENILKAKLEILEGLKPGGIICINNDNDLLNNWAKNVDNYNVFSYGIANKSKFTAKDIKQENNQTTYKINIENKEYTVEVPVIGEHFVYNSLCAMAVGRALNIETEKIIEGISEFKLTAKRMDFRKIKNEVIVLADYYNASYDSMASALKVMRDYKCSRRVAVLGDMLELGEYSKKLHEDVGREVFKNNVDILITVGELARDIASEAKRQGTKEVYECTNNGEAIKLLEEKIKKRDLILLKASNRMNFGEILEAIK